MIDPIAQPLDTFTSNDGLIDSSEDEKYVDNNNENQSERIVQDTNPPSDGGKSPKMEQNSRKVKK